MDEVLIRNALNAMLEATKGDATPIIRRLARVAARAALDSLASAPAGDGVEAILAAWLTDVQRAAIKGAICITRDWVLTTQYEDHPDIVEGLPESIADPVSGILTPLGCTIRAALVRPRAAVGEQSREWWTLEWIGAPRPPVHPNPMKGRQSFATAEKALAFWRKQPADATYVSLTKHSETTALQSPPAKVEGECPSSPDGRHRVDTSMESGPNNCFYCEAPMTHTVDAATTD